MSYSDKIYGVGDPNCPICEGIGYIRYDVPEDHPYFGKALDCECRRNNADSERQSYLRKTGGLENLTQKTFETFDPNGVSERDSKNLHRAYEAARAFAENPMGWLVISGSYGCGKTHLAAAIANAQIEANRRVLFLTVPDLLDHLRGSYTVSDSGETYDRRFDEVKTIPILILDDLGTESPTPWAREKLFQILNHRYTAQLPTVITTNRGLDELEPRVRSRLLDLAVSQQIIITAADYRSAAKAQQDNLSDMLMYSHLTFENFDFRRDLPKAERENLARAYNTAKDFAEKPRGWLVFFGVYGSGKTHLAAAIANRQFEQGTRVVFITVPDLLDHLRATFAPNSNVSYDKRFNELRTTPLLVLDDLGTESATPWAREKLFQLINFRYTAQIPTVITTSYQLEDLDTRLATRLRDQRLSKLIAILAPAYLGERSTRKREPQSAVRD